MALLCVLGDESLCALIKRLCACAISVNTTVNFKIRDADNLNPHIAPDILVVSEGFNCRNYSRIFLGAKYLIIPIDKDVMQNAVDCDGLIITYGFNSKVCVTASSMAGRQAQICVQRDIPTLRGKVEQQEFPVNINPMMVRPPDILAAVAAALVAGVEVDVLNTVTAE
ncbi:MAG: hypothetical protein LBL96_08040 [Clostridiales bacterium]|nr:hypothetical protein [Clostridiales bacterium]